jgi:hypothetical protein
MRQIHALAVVLAVLLAPSAADTHAWPVGHRAMAADPGAAVGAEVMDADECCEPGDRRGTSSCRTMVGLMAPADVPPTPPAGTRVTFPMARVSFDDAEPPGVLRPPRSA